MTDKTCGSITKTLGNESVIPHTFGDGMNLESLDFDGKWLRSEIGNLPCDHVHVVVPARPGIEPMICDTNRFDESDTERIRHPAGIDIHGHQHAVLQRIPSLVDCAFANRVWQAR